MTIEERPTPGKRKYAVVALSGTVTDESRWTFRDYLSRVPLNRHIVFDLGDVRHITGDGIGSLMGAFMTIVEGGGRMSLGNVSPTSFAKLETTHLANVLGADQTLKGAVKKLRRKLPDLTPKEPKSPTYTGFPYTIGNTLTHGKCGGRFIWAGKTFPRFCPCCGRSTKK